MTTASTRITSHSPVRTLKLKRNGQRTVIRIVFLNLRQPGSDKPRSRYTPSFAGPRVQVRQAHQQPLDNRHARRERLEAVELRAAKPIDFGLLRGENRSAAAGA
jgi:hypothetical protein